MLFFLIKGSEFVVLIMWLKEMNIVWFDVFVF